MEWWPNDGVLWTSFLVALSVQGLGLVFVCLEACWPARARAMELWVRHMSRKLSLPAKLKWEPSGRDRQAWAWGTLILSTILFGKIVVSVLRGEGSVFGISAILVEAIASLVVVVLVLIFLQVLLGLCFRFGAWSLKELRRLTLDRAIGGLGLLLVGVGFLMQFCQLLMTYLGPST